LTRSVSLEIEIKSPIRKVWSALTDAQTLSKWMMFEVDGFRPVVGHKFQLRMPAGPGGTVTVDCEVLEVDEPHRLSYSWIVESQAHRTTVTFALSETRAGTTHLAFEQSGFRVDAKQEFGGARAGWTRMLEQLRSVVEA